MEFRISVGPLALQTRKTRSQILLVRYRGGGISRDRRFRHTIRRLFSRHVHVREIGNTTVMQVSSGSIRVAWINEIAGGEYARSMRSLSSFSTSVIRVQQIFFFFFLNTSNIYYECIILLPGVLAK